MNFWGNIVLLWRLSLCTLYILSVSPASWISMHQGKQISIGHSLCLEFSHGHNIVADFDLAAIEELGQDVVSNLTGVSYWNMKNKIGLETWDSNLPSSIDLIACSSLASLSTFGAWLTDGSYNNQDLVRCPTKITLTCSFLFSIAVAIIYILI